MFGLGMPELLVVLVIVVVLFGANKLPQIGAGIGKGIRNFKDASKEGDKKDALEDKKDSGPDKS